VCETQRPSSHLTFFMLFVKIYNIFGKERGDQRKHSTAMTSFEQAESDQVIESVF
jgi:hypothetical protein